MNADELDEHEDEIDEEEERLFEEYRSASASSLEHVLIRCRTFRMRNIAVRLQTVVLACYAK